MPVSHIGLTVSHLPTSCSFFLSALQPLGYRFIGQQGNQIGLGVKDADFFICQETPGVKAGAAHIAFTAPSRAAVRDFYAAALLAGGRPNGAPSCRTEGSNVFNAAVLDLDGNSIEVVFRDEPDVRDDGTVIEHSRVLEWQKDVSEHGGDDRSVVSARSSKTVKALPAAAPPSTMVRSVSAPVAVQAPQQSSSGSGDGAAKKIIGTLLGAAAGAAVAYAMVKAEEDSAQKEAEFNTFMAARAKLTQALEQTVPQLSQSSPRPVLEASPKSVYRSEHNDNASAYSSSRSRTGGPRAIEAPPPARSVYSERSQSYHAPAYSTVAPTQVQDQRAIEYIPAASVAPSRAQFAASRSVTSPDLMSTYSKPGPKSVAASTLISSFVPDHVQRRSSGEGSVHSHQSSRASSRHTSSKAKSPGSIVGSILGRGATVETVHTGADGYGYDDYDDDEIIDINDSDTVAPSDSISQVSSSRRSRHSSSRSHRSHHSHHRHRSGSHERRSSKAPSAAESSHSSRSSKHSKHSSSSSKHSSRSHSSRRSHHRSSSSKAAPGGDAQGQGHGYGSPLPDDWHDVDEQYVVDAGDRYIVSMADESAPRSVYSSHSPQSSGSPRPRSRVQSEPSEASTVKPSKAPSTTYSVHSERSRKSKSSEQQRKDSVTSTGNSAGPGGYAALFEASQRGDRVYSGSGSVASLPVRGITPSMLGLGKRSVVSYAMGQ